MLQLVVVGGWIASGKSSVARAAGAWLRAPVLEADALRAELEAAGCAEARLPGFSETLYPELLARAEPLLAAGRSVVLDGTFRARAQRVAARELALRHGAAFRFVECRAPREICRSRLGARGDPEQVRGWLSLFDHFVASEWEPVRELAPREHRVLDTSRELEESLGALRSWLR
jgi:predicted kinase